MKKVVLFVAVLAISITSGFAELKIYEGFDYEAVGNVGDGSSLTNGYGWAENSYWGRPNSKDNIYINANSLGYGDVVTTGNHFEIGGSSSRSSGRSFAEILDSSESAVFWGGIVFKPYNKADRAAKFLISPSAFYITSSRDETIKIGGGTATEVDTGIISGSSSRLYIYKFDLSDTDPVANVWISPADFSSESALGTPDVTITNVGSSYTAVALFCGASNPSSYDEVRLGTTLEDAWQTLPPVVPVGTLLIIN
ncbi:MAG: hypothetical protein PF692_05745 [Kiritimatiellae bacterium]|jgi:hypothetical protein|nr:hypothetical protein [Kiritimatiellia bacterium]